MKLKIQTSNGVYKYKFVPIYEGIKPINKVIAKENLSLLKELCDEAQLKFILFYGTLLGAVREHDFITHDEDIDVIIYKSDMQKFVDTLFTLRKHGFEIARYERRGFLSIIRKGEYIDIYFFEPYPEDENLWYCCQDICKKEYVTDLIEYQFQDGMYLIPRNYVKYLEYYLGDNWQTPIQFYHFDMSRINLIKQYTIQYLKALLPAWIIEKCQQKKSEKIIKKCLDKIYSQH